MVKTECGHPLGWSAYVEPESKWECVGCLRRALEAAETMRDHYKRLNELPRPICQKCEALQEKLRAAHEALRAVQSQCAGHADEFSGNVWRIAQKALGASQEAPDHLVKEGVDKTVREYWDDLKAMGEEGGGKA